MTDNNELIRCPICKGRGKIERPSRHTGDRKKEAVRLLIKEGFSYREVMRLLDYKSPGSVQKALEE